MAIRSARMVFVYRYLLAMLAVAASIFARWLLQPLVHARLPFVPLYLVLTLIAYFLGAGPTLLATTLGIIATDYFFIPHPHLLGVRRPNDVLSIIICALLGVVTAAMAEANFRERRRAELSESGQAAQMQQWETLLRTLPVPIAIALDRECRNVYTNDAFAPFLKPSHDGDVRGIDAQRPYRVFQEGVELGPEDLPMRTAAREDREVRDWRADIQLADGTLFNFLGFASPTHDSNGRVNGAISAFFDITAAERASLALQKSDELFRFAQQAAVTATWDWDLQTGTLRWAPGSAELYAAPYSKIDHLSRWMEMVHPEDQAALHAAIQRALADHGSLREEFRVMFPQGHSRWLSIRGHAMYDDAGRPIRMIGINVDIHARKENERALVESEAKFRAVSESAAIAIYIHDGQRLLYVNHSAEVATGYSREELLASDMWGLVHPDFRELLMQRAGARLRREDVPERYEYKIIRKDGEERWLDFGATTINYGGRPALLATAFDITDRKLGEDVLRKTEKLAATGRLAATIAHEINNPLEAVTNLLYLLRGAVTPEGKNLLLNAEQELARVAHITKQTLGFFREASEPVRFSLCGLLDEIVPLYANRLERKNTEVKREYLAPGEITAVKGEIRQVLSNLIANAIDSLAVDGWIRLTVRSAGNAVQVSIEDNGSGITPEHRAKLFEPFFTTKKDFGTGLGLWVVKGIVDKHGGDIAVESSASPGQSGACFTVTLPMDFAASQTKTFGV